jgi:Flp pilus assembly pilin Flp
MRNRVSCFSRDESAQGLVEYALTLALASTVFLAGSHAIGQQADHVFAGVDRAFSAPSAAVKYGSVQAVQVNVRPSPAGIAWSGGIVILRAVTSRSPGSPK